MSAGRLALSVIMPLASEPRLAAAALDALAASDLPRASWELIVVAAGQPEAVVDGASERADMIVRLEPNWSYGSAYQYNRGAEVARSPVLVFLDGEVTVRPDTLRRVEAAFADDGLAALVAGIDPAPRSAGLVTRYKTLIQDWAYQACVGESEFFSTHAAAIRASTFFSAGELDEWQGSDSSAAALGVRLRGLGRRIELRTDIRVSYHGHVHWGQAAPPLPIQESPPPWMRDADRAPSTATRRYRSREQWLSRLVWAAVALLVAAAALHSTVIALAASLLGAITVLADAPLGAYLARLGGIGLACAAIPFRLLSLLVRGARAVGRQVRARVIGEPRPAPGLEALTEVGVPHWPPTPVRTHDLAPAEPIDMPAAPADAGHA